jgi:hypothetical protein
VESFDHQVIYTLWNLGMCGGEFVESGEGGWGVSSFDSRLSARKAMIGAARVMQQKVGFGR